MPSDEQIYDWVALALTSKKPKVLKLSALQIRTRFKHLTMNIGVKTSYECAFIPWAHARHAHSFVKDIVICADVVEEEAKSQIKHL